MSMGVCFCFVFDIIKLLVVTIYTFFL